jgi:dienelactone hydrolase
MPNDAFKLRRRRWGRVLGFVLGAFALLTGVLALWLFSHRYERHEHFESRRGAITTAEVGAEVTQPGGYISQSVRVSAETGLVVNFRVLRPNRATKPLPLVILMAGHRTGRDAIELIGDPGPIMVAAMDYPYDGPERPRGVRETARTVRLARQALLDTPPAVSVALDWLVAHKAVDAARIELMGVSLGVPFAAVAGALDERFRRVWLVHGGVDNRAWLADRLQSRISHGRLRETAAGLLHLLAYGASFQNDEWVARIAPRATVVIGARADEQMPPESVEELFAAAREPKTLLWSEGGHVQPNRPEIVQSLLEMARSRILLD